MAKKRKIAPGGGPKRKSRERPVGKRARARRAAIARRKNSAAGGATSAKQYRAAQAVLSGQSAIMPRAIARELVDNTPAAKRKTFARKANPKRRRNQEDTGLRSVEKMYKKFHGKKATRVDIVEQLRVTPDALADCGRLVELVVDTGRGGRRLPWPENGGVRVATTGDGGQLYFVKGDQQVNLAGFPGIRLPKDHLDLGELVSIVYFTSKDFHNFEPSEYEHHFGLDDETGEPRGTRPTLHYDVHSKRLYLTGGTYRTKRPGIVG
jgi:hypothetical protein